MYAFLTQSVSRLNRADEKDRKRKKRARRNDMSKADGEMDSCDYRLLHTDTKSCYFRQCALTGDCWCDDSCSALNGCIHCR